MLNTMESLKTQKNLTTCCFWRWGQKYSFEKPKIKIFGQNREKYRLIKLQNLCNFSNLFKKLNF